MRYDWLDSYLMHKPGVTKDWKLEWNWIRYQIGGKLFAAICLDSQVTDELLKEMPDESYNLVLGSFNKQKQAEILKSM